MDIDRERISYIIGQRIYTFRTQKNLAKKHLPLSQKYILPI